MSGTLPRINNDYAPIRSKPIFKPQNPFAPSNALYGQNDYFDILGKPRYILYFMLFIAILSLCIASHSVHLELPTIAVGLFELALQGAQSCLRGGLCLVVEVPALLIHDRVAAEEVLIVVQFAWERGVPVDFQTSQHDTTKYNPP